MNTVTPVIKESPVWVFLSLGDEIQIGDQSRLKGSNQEWKETTKSDYYRGIELGLTQFANPDFEVRRNILDYAI